MRVPRGFKARRRRNKWLKKAKGFRAGRRRYYRLAKENVIRALDYAYRDRRARKRDFRRLWIARINAAARMNALNYSRLINGLGRAGVELDRKVLADIAVHDPDGFAAIANVARASLG